MACYSVQLPGPVNDLNINDLFHDRTLQNPLSMQTTTCRALASDNVVIITLAAPIDPKSIRTGVSS